MDATSAGHTSFAFQLTQSGSLTNANEFSAATPANDLLHLTGSTPFNLTASPATDNPLTSPNVVNVYLPAASALSAGETFQGGFYADQLSATTGTSNLLADIQHATFNFFTLDPDQSVATGTAFNGQYYLAASSSLQIAVGALNEQANFGAGNINGSIETFTVQSVPEPGSLVLLGFGAAGMVAWRFCRRARMAARACQ